MHRGKDYQTQGVDWAAANRVADAIFAQRTLSEWVPILKAHDVWYARVNRFEEQVDGQSDAYKQASAVGAFAGGAPHNINSSTSSGDDDSGGGEASGSAEISRHDLLVSPVQLSAMPAIPRAPAPVFGADTHAILTELGYTPAPAAKQDDGGEGGRGEATGSIEELLSSGVAAVSKGLRK